VNCGTVFSVLPSAEEEKAYVKVKNPAPAYSGQAQGGALKSKIQNQTEIPNQVWDDKKRKPNSRYHADPVLNLI
jgi:hypothetical protein